jgi:hypothetical protein
LLQIFASRISGRETKYRVVIPPSIRIAVKLRYLATGESFTKSLLQRIPAPLVIHQFLVFSVKLRFQRLLYIHHSNIVFCWQAIICINCALLLLYLT